MPTALITGITGQDGSYLAELLLEKGYIVHGVIRRSSSFNTDRIEHLYQDPNARDVRLFLHYGDMVDASSLRNVVRAAQPDEVYNLAAQSHVKVSFDQPVYTSNVDYLGTLRLLEAVRDLKPDARFYQASTSEMFGETPPPQNESGPFRPLSPYAAAKLAAHEACRIFRDGYEMFVSCGILFNHESPRRGETFLTRKVTRAVGRIKAGLQDELYLGNLYAIRDWGYAPEYVEMMWKMLQHDEPDDFVIATECRWSVQDFVRAAFEAAGLSSEQHVRVVQRYLRPVDVPLLHGDAHKARRVLGWKPKVTMGELVRIMVAHDIELAYKEKRLNG